ncbi:MAG TPA: insulinase family protein, partial [Limnochordia bacterium]|nr:insulinase family protein [Limnochordia bacterium]
MNTMPKVALKPGDRLDAFVVRSVTPIDELRAIAVVLEHPGCGATLLHLVQNDAENLFSVTFKTPPSDDTGVPHILEHAVLAGSAKYPVRDPFFEMLKRSMATYLNAFTMWDATSYPVASNVKQDLFNLADVYFDAVFHPKLTEETFAREGHHLAPVDPADPTGALRVTGIVYNEMKGAFSNPEARLQRVARRTLFGDTIYGHESGGDPDAIPDLTWADLRAFHERYYHPSNALFFVYGDIPTSEWTAFLTARLAGFKPRPADVEIKPQPLWREPRRLDESYAVGAGESLAEKTYLSLRWIVGDSTDPGEITDWRVLSTILLGNEAAPLKRALIASKLGQDLFASGLDANALQSGFGVGLKGSEANRAEAFERLVLDCLRDLAGQTFSPERVEAAYQQAAYFYLEILPSYPLYMLFRVLGTWVHNRDPLAYLPMREHLAASKARYAADPRRFNRMIAEHLVENPHRLLTVMQPDPDWQTRADARFAEHMQRVRAALSDEEAKHISEAAAELDRRSSTPDPPELLATLPVL